MSGNSVEMPGWWILLLAWFIALFATLSAVFIGEVMGQMPCTLCWYQRIAMFPLVLILGLGSFRSDVNAVLYALPLVAVGAVFALYHSLTYAGVIVGEIVPCGSGTSCSGSSMTIFGWLPLPFLALISFVVIACLLCLVIRKNKI